MCDEPFLPSWKLGLAVADACPRCGAKRRRGGGKRAGLRPWRMGAVGCMAAKAPGRARRKGSNGRDGLASCMATTRRKRKPHGQRRVAQCESFNCSCGKWALRRGDRVMGRSPTRSLSAHLRTGRKPTVRFTMVGGVLPGAEIIELFGFVLQRLSQQWSFYEQCGWPPAHRQGVGMPGRLSGLMSSRYR